MFREVVVIKTYPGLFQLVKMNAQKYLSITSQLISNGFHQRRNKN